LIQILLAHGSRLMRQALAAVLSQEDDMKVAWELSAGDDVIAVAVREEPDVVLLDFALPDAAAAGELCERLCSKMPDCRVLMLVDRRACTGLLPVLTRLTPHVGIVATEDSVPRLIQGIRQLMKGEFVLDVELAIAALNADKNPLTDREKDILRLAVQGAPAKEIAARLYLSAGTVRNYLSRVMAKTGARTRIEAVRRAQEAGWI
jgi:two-component system, NarL family, response regulator DesR